MAFQFNVEYETKADQQKRLREAQMAQRLKETEYDPRQTSASEIEKLEQFRKTGVVPTDVVSTPSYGATIAGPVPLGEEPRTTDMVPGWNRTIGEGGRPIFDPGWSPAGYTKEGDIAGYKSTNDKYQVVPQEEQIAHTERKLDYAPKDALPVEALLANESTRDAGLALQRTGAKWATKEVYNMLVRPTLTLADQANKATIEAQREAAAQKRTETTAGATVQAAGIRADAQEAAETKKTERAANLKKLTALYSALKWAENFGTPQEIEAKKSEIASTEAAMGVKPEESARLKAEAPLVSADADFLGLGQKPK